MAEDQKIKEKCSDCSVRELKIKKLRRNALIAQLESYVFQWR